MARLTVFLRLSALSAILPITAANVCDISSPPLIVAPPDPSPSKPDVALFIVTGAQEHPQAYLPLAKKIVSPQHQAEANFFAVVPVFPLDLPDPLQLFCLLTNAYSQLKTRFHFRAAGGKVLLVGHSLGGVILQRFLRDDSPGGNWNGTFPVVGQVLMGAGLLRTYFSVGNDGASVVDFPVPTLCLQGELDGLFRVTRGAEGWFHQCGNKGVGTLAVQKRRGFCENPVWFLDGVSHQQFAGGSGRIPAPSFVLKHDLEADISDDDATAKIAEAIVV